jgi:DNA-binding MarR family transcriptional regulator
MQEISQEMLTNNKWQLLKEIAEQNQSPTELAEKTGTSISNVTQQLKLLEAYNIIRKEKDTEKNTIGKPKTIYSLNHEFVYATMLKHGRAEKKHFKIDGFTKTLFNILFLINTDDIFFMIKFMIQHEDLVKKCKAVGILRSGKDSIELFLITDHVDEIRGKFSNMFIEDLNGHTKKIINWTHNDYEIIDGLNKKDRYYLDMLRNSQTVYDPQDALSKYKERRELIL